MNMHTHTWTCTHTHAHAHTHIHTHTHTHGSLMMYVPLMEFTYLAFTCMPGKSYRRQLRSLLSCLCVFRTLITPLGFVPGSVWQGAKHHPSNVHVCSAVPCATQPVVQSHVTPDLIPLAPPHVETGPRDAAWDCWASHQVWRSGHRLCFLLLW